MENILKVFMMAFPEWLAVIFMVVGLVVTALAAVRLGYGLVVAKTVYKWIVLHPTGADGRGVCWCAHLARLHEAAQKHGWPVETGGQENIRALRFRADG